jgi:hypothetical protein
MQVHTLDCDELAEAMPRRSARLPVFPGFQALSDQVFVRDAPPVDDKLVATTPASKSDPTVIIIYSWGDGRPKHVLKYSKGYQELFPRAKQIIVLSPIMKALYQDLGQRSTAMEPVVTAAFRHSPTTNMHNEEVVLAHAMSNTGGINYAATLHAYQRLYNRPMPHQMVVVDSTPGSPYLSVENLGRWSRAMALGTAAWFPWPFAVTQGIWGTFICANRCFEHLSGREAASVFSNHAVNDETYEDKASRRLYIYSKEDELIYWKDIESHIATAQERGYKTDTKVFSGSGHVAHMRMFPRQYWETISCSWQSMLDN